jgi:hypothetical protein
MVDIITAASVDETIVIPKLSPIKYRNGSKKAKSIKYFKSPILTLVNFLINNPTVTKRKIDEMVSLPTTSVMGL